MQEQQGDGPDPAGGTGDQHRTSPRLDAIVLQAEHTQGGGVAGGPEAHTIHRRQGLGPANEPGARNPDVLAKPAGGVHAQVIPGAEHLVPGLPVAVRGSDHRADSIDSRGVRVVPGYTTVARGGKGILVVERRIAHPDQHLVVRQVAEASFHNGALKLPVLVFCDDKSGKVEISVHGSTTRGKKGEFKTGRNKRESGPSMRACCCHPRPGTVLSSGSEAARSLSCPPITSCTHPSVSRSR